MLLLFLFALQKDLVEIFINKNIFHSCTLDTGFKIGTVIKSKATHDFENA
jgi:hypothetical protein